jgi:hypothetical protein
MRQFIAGEWSGGSGVASAWLGVPWWHTAQVSFCSGSWHAKQWRSSGAPHMPTWSSGSVSWWQRSQESGRWHVAQLSRSMLAARPCPRRRQ